MVLQPVKRWHWQSRHIQFVWFWQCWMIEMFLCRSFARMYIMPRSHRHSANNSVRIHLCVWVCCFHICVCMQSSSLYERITNYIKNVYHICTDISLYSYSTESAIYRATRVKETERCDWNSKIQVSMCVRFPLCYFFSSSLLYVISLSVTILLVRIEFHHFSFRCSKIFFLIKRKTNVSIYKIDIVRIK